MSVMDMLAANEAAEAAENGPAGLAAGGKAKGSSSSSSTRTPPPASGGDVDAMDEDMSGGDGDGSEEGSDEDGDEEEDEDERHARLLGFVGTLGEQAAAARQAAEDRRSSQLLKEGEFNPTAAAATSGAGGAKKGAITMEVRERERKAVSRGKALWCFVRRLVLFFLGGGDDLKGSMYVRVRIVRVQ